MKAFLLFLCFITTVNAFLQRKIRSIFNCKASVASNFLLYSGGKITDTLIYDPDAEPDDAFGRAPDVLPTVSSSINMGDVEREIVFDVWVVGSGTLGELVVKKWREMDPKAKIVAETKTTQRHDKLKSLGAETRLRETRQTDNDFLKSKTVIIALPPSSAEDYLSEIHEASLLWAGPTCGGCLVYTSSVGVYGPSYGNTVNEEFRVDTRSRSSTKLLSAEEAILSREGSVVRLAGLYSEQRGPHTFWFRKASQGLPVETNADGVINMLHYDDAASVTVAAALRPDMRKKIFLASDNEPVTKQEICASALASKLFPDATMPEFTSASGSPGKIVDSSLSRKLLNWEPKYTSFRVFMRRLGGEKVDDVPPPFTQEEKVEEEADASSALWLPGDEDDFGL